MYCEKCGKNIKKDDGFCPYCGTPVPKVNQNNDEVKKDRYSYERIENQQINYNQSESKQTVQSNNARQARHKRKNAVSGIIIVLILLVASIIVFPIFGVIRTLLQVYKIEEMSKNNSIVDTTISDEKSENSYTSSNVTNKSASTYKVNYAGFKLYIPDNYIYELDNTTESLLIADENETWMSQLTITETPYQQLVQKKSTLSTYMNQYLSASNGKTSNATVEKIDGVEFIILEMSAGGENVILALTGLNSMYSMSIMLYNEDNDFDRDYLKNFTSIINTVEYTGTSSYMKTNENIKIEDAIEALEKAVEEE